MIGQTISHYKILKKLGHGGMGVVYKAEDTILRRTVALKLLPPELTLDAEAKERLFREARAASSLQHHNICTIHEIGETNDGEMFFCMDYYEGETLKERLSRLHAKNELPMPVSEVFHIGIQIAQGLAKAHEKGIIHRDIKPANIMLTNDGVVKILDFGLVKLAGQATMTKTSTTFGTTLYMSPEQARGGKVDHRTDIWSLGVVLYEMITGAVPFKAEYEQAVIYCILDKDPVPPKKIRSTIPQGLENIILKALNKKVDKRYQSIHKMLEDLRAIQNEQDAESGSHAYINQLKILYRKPKIFIPVLIIIVVVLFLVTWLIYQYQQIHWARNIALPEIVRLADEDKLHESYTLAVQAEKVIPTDSALAKLWDRFSMYITIHTHPEGAEVFWKEYAAVDAPWIHMGRTPLDSVRLPMGLKRFMIVKDGFQTRYLAPSMHPNIHLRQLSYHLIIDGLALDREKDIPNNMVRVFPVKMLSNTTNEVKEEHFNDFFIDTYEVTNREYKVFADSGGYQRKEYWKNPFLKDGRIIPWERATALFKDKTGRVEPATWEAGDYPTGQEDYPVTGVSWFEAAAYAEFAGKSLPSIYNWERAAGLDAAPEIIPLSNFNESGPAAVGKYQGLGPYGTYDMAGNAREWCWNQKIPGEKHFIRGGACTDQIYEFNSNQVALSPFDRSVVNGFRCMKYITTDSSTVALNRPVKSYLRNVYNEKPVSDKEFNVILRMYDYPKTPLHAVVEKIDTHEKDWTVEKITYDAAYGNERVSAYLFLPTKGNPPYQTVVHFPGSSVMGMHPDGILKPYHTRCFDYILKSGRAVLHPVYQGTFERSYTPPYKMWDGGYLQRDFTIMFAKDLRRSIDYIVTRPDIDTSKLAYYGLSWGAEQGGIMLAIEKRFKAGILYIGGFWIYNKPLLPEIEPLNFPSRVTTPVLMLDGRNDDIYPYKMAQIPFYEFLRTPKEHKKHYVSNSWHFVPRDELIKETLGWLDKYLGPIP